MSGGEEGGNIENSAKKVFLDHPSFCFVMACICALFILMMEGRTKQAMEGMHLPESGPTLYRVSHKSSPIAKIFKVDILNHFTFAINIEQIRNIFQF